MQAEMIYFGWLATRSADVRMRSARPVHERLSVADSRLKPVYPPPCRWARSGRVHEAHEGPKRPPRGPKRPQNGPQEAPKLPPRGPREANHEIPTNIHEVSDPPPRHGGGIGRRPLEPVRGDGGDMQTLQGPYVYQHPHPLLFLGPHRSSLGSAGFDLPAVDFPRVHTSQLQRCHHCVRESWPVAACFVITPGCYAYEFGARHY